jgi:hypothetical protein
MKKNINQITGKKIHRETAWIDKNGKEFKIKDIDNNYLFNICKFMASGGGWIWFLTQKRKNLIFIEARRRFKNDKNKIVEIIQLDDLSDKTLSFCGKIICKD